MAGNTKMPEHMVDNKIFYAHYLFCDHLVDKMLQLTDSSIGSITSIYVYIAYVVTKVVSNKIS